MGKCWHSREWFCKKALVLLQLVREEFLMWMLLWLLYAFNPIKNGFQTTFSSWFSCMKIAVFCVKFHWNLFTVDPVNNNPALVQTMAWHWIGKRFSSEPNGGLVYWCTYVSLSIRGVNTLRLRQNGRHFQTTFSNAYSWMKMYEFRLIFHEVYIQGSN